MKNKELTLEQKIDFINKSIKEIRSNLEGHHYICWKYSILVFGEVALIKKQFNHEKVIKHMKVGFPELYNGIENQRMKNNSFITISFITNKDRVKFLNKLKVKLNSK